MPHSQVSSRWYRNDACRLVATSPGAALRFFFFAIALRVCPSGRQIHASAGWLDAIDDDVDGIAEAQATAGFLGHQRRPGLVQDPPAAETPHRQETLVSLVAKAYEGALLDQPHHLALERT